MMVIRDGALLHMDEHSDMPFDVVDATFNLDFFLLLARAATADALYK